MGLRGTPTLPESVFAERRRADWEQLARITGRARKSLRSVAPEDIARFAPLYRDVCGDLSRARAARYSAPLVEYLHMQVTMAHAVLYAEQGRRRAMAGLRGGLLWSFPKAVRRHGRFMLLSAVLFFGPLLSGAAVTMQDPSFALRIAPETMLRQLAEAYAAGFKEARGFGSDTFMAGFYIHNNVGIALRCFATGVLGGLGSAFFLVFNGLSIGAILGFVASQGAGANLLTFIVGHGSFELGAIVIAGGAGLRLGWSIVAPGSGTRAASLRAVAPDIVVLVLGASLMLLAAAGIEGYWSGSTLPSTVKVATGLLLFVFLSIYFAFGGRGESTTP